MSITLFSDSNFRGDSMVVRNDLDTLRRTQVGNNPSSIKMTEDDDAILLCSKTNWNGEVFYLRGNHEISDLGDPDSGGKQGFRNSVTSVRVTPFTVKVNVTIVTGEDGTLPGTWSSRTEANADIATIISRANDFYEDEKALLKVELADTTFRADEKRFRMSEKEWGSIPASWKKAHLIDVVFPDTIEGAVGLGNFPWHGKFCLVSARRATVDEMARTFVHELGHYWGLTHESGGGNPENIMTQSSTGKHITQSRLRDGQIEDIQQKLARNLARQGDRLE
ncbi:MAG TPA: hypothetical protein VFG47_23840 [Geminicoccaceae bacterium]|nr:hypothetical protein [Geminicoccaceae bacterium]